MNRSIHRNMFRKILIPAIHGYELKDCLRVANSMVSNESVLLAGMVVVGDESSLSAGALPAQELRKSLRELKTKQDTNSLELIRVTNHPWKELTKIVREEKPDLLILDSAHCDAFRRSIPQLLRDAPCNIAVACGVMPKKIQKVFVPMRGGPNAELALRLGLAFSRHGRASIDTLHISPKTDKSTRDVAFRGLERVLNNLPEVHRKNLQTNDPTTSILLAYKAYDVMILGATAFAEDKSTGLGEVAETILRDRSKGLLIVKVHHPASTNMQSEFVGQTAISVLVDRL